MKRGYGSSGSGPGRGSGSAGSVVWVMGGGVGVWLMGMVGEEVRRRVPSRRLCP